MKCWKVIFGFLLLMVFYSISAHADAEIQFTGYFITTYENGNTELEVLLDRYPKLRNSWWAYQLGLATAIPCDEEIGFQINGLYDENIQYESFYDTAGEVSLTVNMIGFESRDYTIEVVITEPDGTQLRREDIMGLGTQEARYDKLLVIYISDCETEGTRTFDFYVDGELTQTIEKEA